MRKPEEDLSEAAASATANVSGNEVSVSMITPTAIFAISLFVIGFANAVIVSALLNIFPF